MEVTRAGPAGRVAPPAALAVLVIALRTVVHTLPSVGQVEEVLPTAQTVGVPRAPAGVTGGVTALTQHGHTVPIMTAGRKQMFFNYFG